MNNCTWSAIPKRSPYQIQPYRTDCGLSTIKDPQKLRKCPCCRSDISVDYDAEIVATIKNLQLCENKLN